ncbi:MAG: response regulator [Anaerolineae bacterium]|nr:response regulator [Anaerolineae bacterium]MCA9888041.1 response regulator [Anaerolineae bacterium]MCA9894959.1 response regulator [Anaerolineae bacterium]
MDNKILIIEDDYALSDLFRRSLVTQGYEVELVYDGTAAIELLKQTTPDLIVLDLHLPGASGYDILEFIRGAEHLANTRVVAATASTVARRTPEIEGADVFLMKPVNMRELRTIVTRLLPINTSS